MNALGTYQGSDLSDTLLRISWPMSPIKDPSRASTRDDCASWMICHASPVEPGAGLCAVALEATRAKSRTSRDDRKTLLQLVIDLVHTKLVCVLWTTGRGRGSFKFEW